MEDPGMYVTTPGVCAVSDSVPYTRTKTGRPRGWVPGRIVRVGFLLVACLLVVTTAQAAVQRGPYLQLGTPTSVVVRWRTDVATNSLVRFGTQPGSLTLSASNSTSSTNHEVTITGLQPATRYYYNVGSSTAVQASGSDYSFVTSPPVGTATPTRVWVLGDSGTKGSAARSVRDAYRNFTGTTRTSLWLMLGDNAYSDGTDSDYQAAVFTMYPDMLRQAVLWPTLGNHDGHSADSGAQSGVYYGIFTLPKRAEAGGLASGTGAY